MCGGQKVARRVVACGALWLLAATWGMQVGEVQGITAGPPHLYGTHLSPFGNGGLP
jgi:hypothetical protein